MTVHGDFQAATCIFFIYFFTDPNISHTLMSSSDSIRTLFIV